RHHQEGMLRSQEWSIKLLERFTQFSTASADHDAVGFHEIVDRGAFFHEFRIAHDVDLVPASAAKPIAHRAVRSDGNGALDDYDFWAVDCFGDAVDNCPE